MKPVYSWLTSSRTPVAMTLAWGAKARGRRRHRDPFFFRPLRVKGLSCALTGRAAFLFRRNPMECDYFYLSPLLKHHPRPHERACTLQREHSLWDGHAHGVGRV